MKKKYIDVPENGYAYITPETPNEIVGMCVDGLNTCSSVIIKVSTGGYLFLCHAEPTTCLDDQHHGIPAWIALIPPEINIEIIYDNLRTIDGIDDFYGKEISDIVNNMSRKNIQCRCEPNGTLGAILHRESGRIENIDESRTTLLKREFTLDKSEIYFYMGDLSKGLQRLGYQQYPPICVFDGYECLSIDRINNLYENNLIRHALELGLAPTPTEP